MFENVDLSEAFASQLQSEYALPSGQPAPYQQSSIDPLQTGFGGVYPHPSYESSTGYVSFQCLDPVQTSDPSQSQQVNFATTHNEYGSGPDYSQLGPSLSINQPLSPTAWSAGIPTPRELTFRRSVPDSDYNNSTTRPTSSSSSSSSPSAMAFVPSDDLSSMGFGTNSASNTNSNSHGMRYVSNSAYPTSVGLNGGDNIFGYGDRPVSYTHLTLPTKRIV